MAAMSAFLDSIGRLQMSKTDNSQEWLTSLLDAALPDILLANPLSTMEADGSLYRPPLTDEHQIFAPVAGSPQVWDSKDTLVTLVSDPGAPDSFIKFILSKPFDPFPLPGLDFSRPQIAAHLELRVHETDAGEPFGTLFRWYSAAIQAGDASASPLAVQIVPRGTQQLFLEADFAPDQGPALGNLFRLLGHAGGTDHDLRADLDWLPPAVSTGSVVAVTQIYSIFERETDDLSAPIHLNYLALDFSFLDGHAWQLIPGFPLLRVGQLEATLRVDHPLEADFRFATIQVGGTLEIDVTNNTPARIRLSARWPDYAVEGNLIEGDRIPVAALLRQLGVPAALLPAGDNALVITDLYFAAEPMEENKTFSFHGTIENVWRLDMGGGQFLEITELSLLVDYQAKPEAALSGSFFGRVAIGGHALFLMATAGSEGWEFRGGTDVERAEGEGPLAVGAWIASFVDLFGGDSIMPVPAAIADFTVSRFEVSFNTGTHDFHFNCDCASGSLKASLELAIERQADGKFKSAFSGHLEVAERRFNLLFQGGAGSLLLAAYHSPWGDEIAVRDLIAAAAPDFVLPDGFTLTIDLETALLALEGGNDNLKLFALDFGAGIDLTALPLVGGTLSPAERLSLALQLIVSSREVKKDEAGDVIAPINALLPAGATPLPEKSNADPLIAVGLGLSAKLVFGAEHVDVSLPVKADEETGALTESEAAPTPGPVDAPVETDGVSWYDLQKQFGPLHFRRIGLRYRSGKLSLWLDAALTAAGLTLSLDGLGISTPLTELAPTFHLHGLGLDYRNGPVAISGAFLRQTIDGVDEYAGVALIKTEQATLSAIGSYAYFQGHPSLFIYAVLDYPLGGPAFFYVTGLAAGFGYNRALRQPAIEEVQHFPLVDAAVRGASLPEDPSSELAKMAAYITPSIGDYFLTVGIKFTSFKIVDSFALLTLTFGREFEVGLLGVSTLISPTPVPDSQLPPLAEIHMVLRARYIPARGFLGVEAQLTPDSYILSRDCHLTGGFAFYSWFDGEHTGDFVITIGGYHPDFAIPSHYPRVPRLGFNWQIDPQTSLKGEMYFALMPHMQMAGGRLEANYHSGCVRAWFKLAVDFQIAWQPYHYDARLSVDIGGSFALDDYGNVTIGIDVSADLHIWGPAFGGKAHLDLGLVSFEVTFGEQGSQTSLPLNWDKFKNAFLPPPEAVVSIGVRRGLAQVVTTPDDTVPHWIVKPGEFVLVTNSVIPATAYKLGDMEEKSDLIFAATEQKTPLSIGTAMQTDPALHTQPLPDIGVGAMGKQVGSVAARHTISIQREGSDVEDAFEFVPILKRAPQALWGGSLAPRLNGPGFIEDTLAGFDIRPAGSPTPGRTHTVDPQNFQYDTDIHKTGFQWSPLPTFTKHVPLADQSLNISDAPLSPAAQSRRAAVLAALSVDPASIALRNHPGSDFVFTPQNGLFLNS